MPEVTGAIAPDLKALAELADDRFHQMARTLPSGNIDHSESGTPHEIEME